MVGKTHFSSTPWKQITSDPWVLNNIKGYRLQFREMPKQFCLPKQIESELNYMEREIQTILQKCIIADVSRHPRQKKDGSHLIILSLKVLNKFVEHHHFKIDTLKSAVLLVRPGCFSASIRNAHYSIRTSAPRVFTTIVKCAFFPPAKAVFKHFFNTTPRIC